MDLKNMLIFREKNFIQTPFSNEEELENVVTDNYEYIFGPNSFYLPKKLIKTSDGSGTIPDGFAIDIENKKWFIVEAELLKHSVWNHIAPQVAKQIIASQQSDSKKAITSLAIEAIRKEPEKLEDIGVDAFDLSILLNEILEKQPIIGLPIDQTSADLEEWANTLKNTVNIWLIKKYQEIGSNQKIIYELPEEYKPFIDTEDEKVIIENDTEKSIKTYNISIYDLIKSNLLNTGEELVMSYKPKNRKRKEYIAQIDEEGNLSVLGEIFSSPSWAALAGIQDAGSPRKTVNGWLAWKTKKGDTLAMLRNKYLELREKTS